MTLEKNISMMICRKMLIQKKKKKLVWKEYNRARENSNSNSCKRRKISPEETFLGTHNLVGIFPQNPT